MLPTIEELNALTAEIERRKAAGTFTPPRLAAPAAAPPPPAPTPAPAPKPAPATLREYLDLPGARKAEVDPALVTRLTEEFHLNARLRVLTGAVGGAFGAPIGTPRREGAYGAAALGDAGASVRTLSAELADRAAAQTRMAEAVRKGAERVAANDARQAELLKEGAATLRRIHGV